MMNTARSLGVFALLLTMACCTGAGAMKQAVEAPTDAPFTVTEMGTFKDPWAMTFLPNGSAFITQKGGVLVLRYHHGQVMTVTGTPKVATGGQGGLGDIVLHPDFAKNGFVYLSWVEEGEGCRGAVVGRATFVEAHLGPALQGLKIIWRQTPKVSGKGHFGHRIAFGPDRKLYISSGERQKFDPAQDMFGNLGKIVRLNDDGSRADDNPFQKAALPLSRDTKAMEQIWSRGHRNPLGLAFDTAGRLWETEMGPKGGDELNLITRGANYGYPKVSNGSHYDGRDIPDHKAGDGFEAPKLWWNPSISPASLMIYTGALFPAWKGDAFIGALSGEALIRVHLDGETATKADQWSMKTRIREVEQGPDGAIWLLEDGEKGRLLRLTPKEKEK
jgi:aldose sugar dehydrogenase